MHGSAHQTARPTPTRLIPATRNINNVSDPIPPFPHFSPTTITIITLAASSSQPSPFALYDPSPFALTPTLAPVFSVSRSRCLSLSRCSVVRGTRISDTYVVIDCASQVKLVKCLVQNIVVDVTFNQLGGLSTLCFLEQLVLANPGQAVLDKLHASDFANTVGDDNIFLTVSDVVAILAPKLEL